jgi:hypothetical protein
MIPTTIATLFLISIFVENKWTEDSSKKLLVFINNVIQGKAIDKTSLKAFVRDLDSIQVADSDSSVAMLLIEELPQITESIYHLEAFIDQVSQFLKMDDNGEQLVNLLNQDIGK